MESTVYRETLSVTATEISDEDKALGRRYNEVLWRALEQAETYLLFGPETARLQITKSFLQSASRLSAIDSQTEVETHRKSFLAVLSKMTDVIPAEIVDAETKALAGRSDDQDE